MEEEVCIWCFKSLSVHITTEYNYIYAYLENPPELEAEIEIVTECNFVDFSLTFCEDLLIDLQE